MILKFSGNPVHPICVVFGLVLIGRTSPIRLYRYCKDKMKKLKIFLPAYFHCLRSFSTEVSRLFSRNKIATRFSRIISTICQNLSERYRAYHFHPFPPLSRRFAPRNEKNLCPKRTRTRYDLSYDCSIRPSER